MSVSIVMATFLFACQPSVDNSHQNTKVTVDSTSSNDTLKLITEKHNTLFDSLFIKQKLDSLQKEYVEEMFGSRVIEENVFGGWESGSKLSKAPDSTDIYTFIGEG